MLALLALASSAVWGCSDFLGGLLSKRLPPLAVIGWSQAAALVGLTLWVSLIAWPDQPSWVLWAAAAAVAGDIGLVCFYAALAGGTMGIVAAVASLGAAVPVVLGILMGEQPTVWALVGMPVAIAGVALACGPSLRAGLQVKPVALAAIAAVAFGLALFFIDRGARVSFVHTLWGMRLLSVTILVAVALVVRSVGGVRRGDLLALCLVGVGDASANALFAVASSRGLVSVASVLASLYPLMTILLARVFLHERLTAQQWSGVAIALTGVVAIASG